MFWNARVLNICSLTHLLNYSLTYLLLQLKIARLPRHSHISSYNKEHFQSLLALNTQFSLFSQMEVVPKYLRDVIRLLPHILRSLETWELFVPQTMTKSRSFSAAGPSAISSCFLSSNLSTSLTLLKTCLFSSSSCINKN